MQKIHVLSHKDELEERRLGDKVAVVIDVLFATSTVVAALHYGSRAVQPVALGEAARAAVEGRDPDSYLLAGEHNAVTLAGFAPFAPLGLLACEPAGKSLIYVTTNGTVALCRASKARFVYAAALLNGAAVAQHIRRHHQAETVLVVCAGSRGRLSLEDFYGAGYLVEELLREQKSRWALTDAALAAHSLYKSWEPRACLLGSRVGQMMLARDCQNEVEYAARLGVYPTVPRLDGGWLYDLARASSPGGESCWG
ncbi:MAG: 2-phosphosulfolactate phosphatase [Candidatus Competibacterales bacterium]